MKPYRSLVPHDSVAASVFHRSKAAWRGYVCLAIVVVANLSLIHTCLCQETGQTAKATVTSQAPKPDCKCAAIDASKRYSRSLAEYKLPAVRVTDMSGREVSLASVIDDGPVMLQFVFTTCPTICPILTGTFSAVQDKLGEDRQHLRMITISIDPEFDTPARLRKYAQSFKAQPQWKFYTGKLADIEAIQKAFQTYRGNKMRHEPLTFLRASPEERWVRLNGLLSAADLAREYETLVQNDAAADER